MKRFGLRADILIAACLLALVCAPAHAWLRPEWPYRRAINIPADYKPSRLAGDDVAVATLPTGGLSAPDGSDIRVTTFDGTQVSSRVLMTGPGDTVKIAFALRGGGKYYAYIGGPKTELVKELDIRRGALLEMWEYPGGSFRTIEQAQEILKEAKVLLGRDIRDRIFSAHNPFGPSDKIAAVYTAWINLPEAGNYLLASSSQNGSFVFVDDKLVVSNGGAHGVQADVTRVAAPVAFTAGLHKIVYYHISPGGDPYAVLAWCPPTEKDKRKFIPVPPGAYTPFVKASAGVMEQLNKGSVDFLFDHVGEAYMENRYYQRYSFSAAAALQEARPIQWKWDFGDGQTSTDAEVQHVFLLPGEYTVVLTGKTKDLTMTRTNKVFVARPWDRVTQDKLDLVGEHAKIVVNYDFRAMKAEACAEAAMLLKRAGSTEGVIRAGDAFITFTKIPGNKVAEIMPIYVEQLLATAQNDKAIASLLKTPDMTADPAVCAAMLVRAAQLCVEKKADLKQGAEIFNTVIKRYEVMVTSNAIREARIGLGDIYRAEGDYDKAKTAYQAAKGREGKATEDPFFKGDYARHVDEYLRTKDFDSAARYLDEWAMTYPVDKLAGYWSLLKAKLLVARGLHQDAAIEAQVLVKVNPASNYGAELLMLAANCYKNLKQPEKAEELLKQITKDFRESPLAAEAAKMLGK